MARKNLYHAYGLGHAETPVPDRPHKSGAVGPVSSWMGVPHSNATGCCFRAIDGEALNWWVYLYINKQIKFCFCFSDIITVWWVQLLWWVSDQRGEHTTFKCACYFDDALQGI